ncbi:hypothetical protein MRB53_023352 [Persea americana]|uniref:Uncharacterized protein n=1 Tax=Persea americana TaxID=3435 RepID=A0ACC2LAF5_PERAE|nr:hypothetical protein MRB53_023352 [Persea americana]
MCPKLLKCASNDDMITVKAEDDADTVTFIFESPRPVEYLGNWGAFREREEERDGGREVFVSDSYVVGHNGDDGDGEYLFCG